MINETNKTPCLSSTKVQSLLWLELKIRRSDRNKTHSRAQTQLNDLNSWAVISFKNLWLCVHAAFKWIIKSEKPPGSCTRERWYFQAQIFQDWVFYLTSSGTNLSEFDGVQFRKYPDSVMKYRPWENKSSTGRRSCSDCLNVSQATLVLNWQTWDLNSFLLPLFFFFLRTYVGRTSAKLWLPWCGLTASQTALWWHPLGLFCGASESFSEKTTQINTTNKNLWRLPHKLFFHFKAHSSSSAHHLWAGNLKKYHLIIATRH